MLYKARKSESYKEKKGGFFNSVDKTGVFEDWWFTLKPEREKVHSGQREQDWNRPCVGGSSAVEET